MTADANVEGLFPFQLKHALWVSQLLVVKC